MSARVESHVPERRELGQALLAWAAAVRRETGAVDAHVYEDVEAPAAFCLVARWDSQHAMETHVRGTEFGALLGALELLARLPQLSITAPGDANVSEALQRVRRLRSGAPGITSQEA